MSRYCLPIDWDAMGTVIVSVLKEDLDQMRKDWEKVYETKRGFVWTPDYELDLEHISAHITALKKIIRYYGGQP